MSQHTAGPWTPHATSVAKEGKDYEYTIASVSSILPNDEARANARLIAAAPELLEACKAAKQAIANAISFVNDEAAPTSSTEISTLFAQLYAAIAKATGAE